MSQYTKKKNRHTVSPWLLNITNNPYYEVDHIATRFNNNVPKVSNRPELSEYGLSDNAEEQIKEEEKRIKKKYDLFFYLAFLGVFVIFALVMHYRGWGVKEILGAAFAFFWFGLIAFELLFSTAFDKRVSRGSKKKGM